MICAPLIKKEYFYVDRPCVRKEDVLRDVKEPKKNCGTWQYQHCKYHLGKKDVSSQIITRDWKIYILKKKIPRTVYKYYGANVEQ